MDFSRKWKTRDYFDDLVRKLPKTVDHIENEDLRQLEYRKLQRAMAEKLKKVTNTWYDAQAEDSESLNRWRNKQELIDFCWETEGRIHDWGLQPVEEAPGVMNWVPEIWKEAGIPAPDTARWNFEELMAS